MACGKEFVQKGNLRTHEKSVHLQRKVSYTHVCNMCTKVNTFCYPITMCPVSIQFQDHRCVFCGKAFAQSGNLRTHMKSVHQQQKVREHISICCCWRWLTYGSVLMCGCDTYPGGDAHFKL